jgi:lipoprotein-anchoring transpeptidase ErfK/SrfK
MQLLRHRGWAALPSTPNSTLALLAVGLAALIAGWTSPATAGPPAPDPVAVQPTQSLAILLGAHTAMAAPDEQSATVQQVSARRPITEEPTVLPVIGRESGTDRVGWLEVRLPGRPNGHTGWIKQAATRSVLTTWQIVVDTSERRVLVYQQGRRVRAFKAVVGKPSTPTPSGAFFVEEVIQLREGDVGAPFALALSARSNVLQEFGGGPGQIGLHGLSNVGGVLGSAASQGCVRLANTAMRWLVVRIGPGVPVTVTS